MPNRLVAAHEDDLGRRAQILADTVSLPVLAYERAGTATAEKISPYSPEGLLGAIEERAKEIAKASQEYETLHAVGHSAAAAELLLIGATGILPFGRIVALDPVMMEKKGTSLGTKDWMHEQIFKKYEPISFFEGIELGEPIPDLPSGVAFRRVLKEFRTYRNCFWTDLSMQAIRRIEEAGQAEVHLYLAGDSEIADAEKISGSLMGLQKVVPVIVPGANHSFPEPYGNFMHLAAQHI